MYGAELLERTEVPEKQHFSILEPTDGISKKVQEIFEGEQSHVGEVGNFEVFGGLVVQKRIQD
jgi:hypothetical protein